jgi:3-ketosteroid 9alpha-monooxygenase subunit A
VYIGRRPGDDSSKAETRARAFGDEVIRQFAQDIDIWSHQRYSDPPALTTDENKGFTAVRKWAQQFYPEPTLERNQ